VEAEAAKPGQNATAWNLASAAFGAGSIQPSSPVPEFSTQGLPA
jgi:hypothetical protein